MKYFYLFIFTFSIGLSTNAQDREPTFNLNLDSVNIDQVIRPIEAITDYQFYYDPVYFDTLKFSISTKSATVKSILDKVFSDTDINYSIDTKKRIFLTHEKKIVLGLPVDFFNESQESLPDEEVEMFDYMQTQEEVDVIASIENKLFKIGKKNSEDLSGTANLAGYVKDIDSGEPVIGAVIYIENPRIGVATDQYGYYSITLPKGQHELLVSTVGMRDTKRQIVLYSNGKLDIELKEDVVPLREVVVESERDVNVRGLEMGVEKLDMKTLKQVPTSFGETDILKVALTLPGVQSVGENSTGLNVRGGTTDQNLILYNDATIYNPSHLFGFFSAFNPDMLKNVELYKSGIPANYGGRLSSVMEISSREGNKKKFVGAGGIGLLTSRLSFEGPVIKDKMSFVIGGRSTYSDWLLDQLDDASLKNSDASFYDLNAHLHYDINENNSLYLTGYYSKDRFRLNSDTLYHYSNQALSAKWKHVFKNELYGVFTASTSQYEFEVESNENPVDAFALNYDINQYTFKSDFNFFPNSSHSIDFGYQGNYYKLHPGDFEPNGEESLIISETIEEEQALESALYLGDKFELNSKLSIYLGLRYSMFNYLGPKEVYQYADGLPIEENNRVDTVTYDGGIIQTYHGPEYRVSLRYLVGPETSVKVSYNRMRQYIHMLSNSATATPTDIWKLSDTNIRPQIGDQYALGIYKNFRSGYIETSIETYYKDIKDFLDYKSGATLILNPSIETDVLSTKGKAYGVEVMVKKLKGKLNGWVNYTYSRSLLRTEDDSNGELINNGDYYPSNFDKPHDFTLVSNYRFNRRFSISMNFTYSTGRPVTIPLSKYTFDGAQRVHYSDRNQYRIPDYYRFDLSMNIEGNHKIRKLAHSSWTIGLYNVTGRKNAYSVYFLSEDRAVNGYKLSIFGQPIPTITYNFRF